MRLGEPLGTCVADLAGRGLAASVGRVGILAGVPDRSDAGADTVHYANGNVKHRGEHLDGEMHGPWEFFRLDGSLMRAGSFDRGRQVGVWRTYDRSGKVVKETHFP